MKKELPSLPFYYEIAAKAVTLREKIDEPQRFSFIPASDPDLEQRLAEWRKVVGPDDPAMFENRLKNDGLKVADLRNLLGSVSFEKGGKFPDWIATFTEMMEFTRSYAPADLSAEMTWLFGDREEKETPFLHLTTPFVAYALHQLDKAVGERKEKLFSMEAMQMLHRQLARILVFHASQTFHLEFKIFCAIRKSSITRLFEAASIGQKPETGLYVQFFDGFQNNGWEKFFTEYSSLAKIMTVLVTNWICNSGDFINRLADDLHLITDHFSGGNAPGLLTEFKAGISDSHDHGKGVISLTFESGLKLVYKPKNLELEQGWSEFLDWFNKKGLTPGLNPLDVVQRSEYGWVGFIEAAECASLEDVSDYYRRIGSLIGMIYLLNGNDFHQENLIASGAHPVLIDLESVMHHQGKAFADEITDSALFLLNRQFGASVFRTGLLPLWIAGKDGFAFDVSGIGGYGQGESPYQRPVWTHINTDRMDLSFVPLTFKEEHNLPVFSGKPQPPGAYTDEIVSGFKAFYHLLIRHRQELPLQLFAGKELRFIFRSTRIYGMIMKKLMNPKYMRSGIERGIQIELLCRAFLHTRPPNPYWALSKSEQRQLEEMDFPIFWADSDKTNLKDNSGIVCKDYMRLAVYEDVTNRLMEMDEKDLEKQIKFIRAALFFRDTMHDFVKNPVETDTIHEEIDPVTRETLVAKSVEIARSLHSEAIFSKDGSCSWMSVAMIPGTEYFRMQPMSMFLYDGLPGVALFLSALASVCDDPEVRRLNDATILSIRQGIADLRQYGSVAKNLPIGICSGLPSMVYSLLKISDFLGNPSFIEDAVRVSEMISPTMIHKDKAFDIMSGSAGCILSMISLYNLTKQRQTLEKAILCGDHLLSNLTETQDGHFGWITWQGKMLTGFSHGQAGIAYSLVKLSEATGEGKYHDAAGKAIEYENSLFSAEQSNWPDLRKSPNTPDKGPEFMSAWCHGAPGIGLARMASQHLLNNAEIEKNIIAATLLCFETPVTVMDHLCCGNLGRIEAILTNAIKTGNEELMKTVYQKTTQIFQRAGKNGHFNLFAASGADFFNPGFFQGLSGIGYELLRLAYPERMPSILIFE